MGHSVKKRRRVYNTRKCSRTSALWLDRVARKGGAGLGSEVCASHCNRFAPRWRRALPLGLIFGLVLLQQVPASLGQSATFDEMYHISAGYAFWLTGDMHGMLEHPPLTRQMAALPLLLLNLRLPTNVENRGDFAHHFLFDNNVTADTILFWARLPIMGLTVLLIWGIYNWARELWGVRAGWFAALIAALDPNIIAHGQLATTDLGVTCFFFLAVYAFWRFLRSPSYGRLTMTGFVTGLACVSKFSAVMAIPVLALLGLFQSDKEAKNTPGRWLLPRCLLVICLITLAVLVLDYGGELCPVWDMVARMQTSGQADITPPNTNAVVNFFLAQLPIPAPSYWYGMWLVQNRLQSGLPAFLWGQRSGTGWWYYFPAVLLIKTPIATLIMVGVALASLLRAWSHSRYTLAFLMLPVTVWLATAMVGRLNLGYRHILPIWPFLFVVVGSLAAAPPIGWKRFALLALIGWLAVSAITIFPHHLAYFNELVGGPDEGYRYLVDSNLDWGQDLKGLARYQREHALGKIYLAYFGTADPDTYGIEYECMPSYGLLACDDAPIPRSGTLAVSATCLQGGCTADPQAYRWLLDETPVAKIGYSIFIYELP